jgi:hypothetical protein
MTRKNTGFVPMPIKTRMQDPFLQNNNYLVDQKVKMPKGGACEGYSVENWFPVSQRGAYKTVDLEKQAKAIAICRGCSIRSECLTYSLEYEPHGIWGGFIESTRAILATFWKIENKRMWVVRPSYRQYRNVIDYIVHPDDIDFIRTVASEHNFTQPPFDERLGISAAAQRRLREGMAYQPRR